MIKTKTLFTAAMFTAIIGVVMTLYIVWFGGGEIVAKLFVTNGILFVASSIGYLVIKDVHEEQRGKDDGTIAS
jgi:hypothetical protein